MVYGAVFDVPIATPSCAKTTFETAISSLASALRMSEPFAVKKSPLVVSYLSLYLNVAYAAGLAGAALLLAFLAHPLVATLRRGSRLAGAASLPLVAAYVAALVAFAGAVEELTLSFALAYALLAWHSRRHAGAPRTARPADASASP